MGPSLTAYRWVARDSANRASPSQISLLREGEHVWSWFPAADTTSQAAVPTEPEAAQILLGPMGSRGLGENEAGTAILSQDSLGLRFVPEHSFPLQNAAPRSAFCAVSELGPRWGPPELAMAGLLGPVHPGLLEAKSALSVKEKTFGVGFKVRRPPAKQQCPRSQRQPRPSLALWGA